MELGFPIFKPLVIIPTFNESESIVKIIQRLMTLSPLGGNPLEVLIVDDNSPDGTSKIVKELNLDRVHVLDRKGKEGLGKAYRAGFSWGLENSSFTHFVSMDGDGSHRVKDLPPMLLKAHSADVVMGSRWMPEGNTVNWPMYRKLISKVGTAYARLMLRMPYSDLTGGFRVYSREIIERIGVNTLNSEGYSFQIEMIMKAHKLKADILESPITFVERESGQSKMSKRIVLEALLKVTYWGLKKN